MTESFSSPLPGKSSRKFKESSSNLPRSSSRNHAPDTRSTPQKCAGTAVSKDPRSFTGNKDKEVREARYGVILESLSKRKVFKASTLRADGSCKRLKRFAAKEQHSGTKMHRSKSSDFLEKGLSSRRHKMGIGNTALDRFKWNSSKYGKFFEDVIVLTMTFVANENCACASDIRIRKYSGGDPIQLYAESLSMQGWSEIYPAK
ncbi:hypothetical protein DFS33DRAFT_1451551 [Desarmillaria ectypa]|nr:hypothetical protein DFS33DRAFT_1451551 [Desarmillaria ectypa]